jgi:hypothetical protein
MVFWATWVASEIASYVFEKGLDYSGGGIKKLFSNENSFKQHLSNAIYRTIEKYKDECLTVSDEGNKFAFYKSEILVSEFLKFRLFGEDKYQLDPDSIQDALAKNPNIVKPSIEEIRDFFRLFDETIEEDEKLKQLEIKEFHEETLFDVYGKVEQILDLLENHLVEVVGLLEEEYKESINECLEELNDLRPYSALKRLNTLESRVDANNKHISKKLKANLFYIKGLCYETIGESEKSFETFISAYKQEPDIISYKQKACLSYYGLKDDKYKILKKEIEEQYDYNIICWSIEAINKGSIDFIKDEIPNNVIGKNYFKRLVFRHLLKSNSSINRELLIDAIRIDSISRELPNVVAYNNFHHWVFLLELAVEDCFTHTFISFFGPIEKNEYVIFFYELSKVLYNKIAGSEIEEQYSKILFYYYWLECEVNITSDLLFELEKVYKKLENPNNFDVLLFANVLQKKGKYDKALDVIKNAPDGIDEHLTNLKTCFLINSSGSGIDTAIYEYLESIVTIKDNNIESVLNYILYGFDTKILDLDRLIYWTENVMVSETFYREILAILVQSIYNTSFDCTIDIIKTLESSISKKTSLYYYLGVIYYELGFYEECVNFIGIYVNKEIESKALILYIRALYATKNSRQIELLNLLQKWRQHFSFNSYFCKIEIELRHLLKDWDRILNISELGYKKIPNDEYFFFYYIMSLAFLRKEEELKRRIPFIEEFPFHNSDNALSVADILLTRNYEKEALEIVYQKAKNKNNTKARINYFLLSTRISENLFISYDFVKLGRYVKYEINKDEKTFYLDEESLEEFSFLRESIGKRVRDSFTIQSSITSKFTFVKVLRVMNKYLSLGDEISNEGKNPFTSLPLESFEFKDLTKEGIERTFIENFGPLENEKKEHTQEKFNAYYQYEITLSELVRSNFEGSYIDAYLYLTSHESNGFCVMPIGYQRSIESFDNLNLVLDFSSGLLLFGLEDELKIKVNKKFIIPRSLISIIDLYIYQSKHQSSELRLSIQKGKLIPRHYPKDYYKNRVDFLKKIKKWFLDNSEIITPEEKLNLVRSTYEEKEVTPLLEYFLDISILSQRENYLLISDDLIFGKALNVKEKIFSTENYLITNFPDRKNKLLEFLLKKKYLGLTLDEDVLYSAYINQNLEDQNFIYFYAKRNITLGISFSKKNVIIIIKYLKLLALKSITVTYEVYKMMATDIIVMAMSNFVNESFYDLFRSTINKEFLLMGKYKNIIDLAFLDALYINNNKFKL